MKKSFLHLSALLSHEEILEATQIKEHKEQELLKAFEAHESFVKCMLDAWVLIDDQGKILRTNQLLTQVTGESNRKALKAKSLDDLLTMSIPDQKLNVANLLRFETPTRIDEVNASSAKRENMTLIMGVYPFISKTTSQPLGAFLLLRDVTDDKQLYDKYKDTKTDSITDQLTGLFTRRYFEDYLEHLENAPPSLQPVSLVMADIDFFKKVNDVHGHQAGDHVLKITAEIMLETFRKTDVPCRYGGEEFLIILPSTDMDGAIKAAENLVRNVEAYKMVFEGTHIPVTISCGVAQYQPDTENFTATMARADSALYKAKENGRNQVKSQEH